MAQEVERVDLRVGFPAPSRVSRLSLSKAPQPDCPPDELAVWLPPPPACECVTINGSVCGVNSSVRFDPAGRGQREIAAKKPSRVSSVYTAPGQPRSPGRWNPHYNIKFNLITIFAILIIITITITIIIIIILVLITNTITTPIIFIIIITIVISTTLRLWQKACVRVLLWTIELTPGSWFVALLSSSVEPRSLHPSLTDPAVFLVDQHLSAGPRTDLAAERIWYPHRFSATPHEVGSSPEYSVTRFLLTECRNHGEQ
ncbi:unnamed protein product [Boreogadus saida]